MINVQIHVVFKTKSAMNQSVEIIHINGKKRQLKTTLKIKQRFFFVARCVYSNMLGLWCPILETGNQILR